MKLTSGPLFRFLSPVIDIYALPALSTSIQFTLCFLHPTPFLASLLSPWVYTFLFLKISLFKIVIFTCSLGGILPLFSLSASQIYSCELRISALFISQVSINGCARVCLSLFFWYLYVYLIFSLEISYECEKTNRKIKFFLEEYLIEAQYFLPYVKILKS